MLTPASLATGHYGLLGRVAVQGRIYAQPLYIEKAAVICDGRLQSRDVAFVATLENRVYAIDVGIRGRKRDQRGASEERAIVALLDAH